MPTPLTVTAAARRFKISFHASDTLNHSMLVTLFENLYGSETIFQSVTPFFSYVGMVTAETLTDVMVQLAMSIASSSVSDVTVANVSPGDYVTLTLLKGSPQ